jgi:hypothetical protein
MLHGDIPSARLKAVPIPNSSARASISWAAGSIDDSSGVRRFFLGVVIDSLAIV